ncbi:MAG TPA: hypothetical protein VKY33_08815 [Flavobacterium sp.]|nr:hypothetical protein [Flavobacterium sp.]
MSHNGKDTSGNALKYSLIPLFLGIVVIFFLYRSCGNSTYEPQPATTTTSVAGDTVTEPSVVEESAEATTDTINEAIENDTIRTEE